MEALRKAPDPWICSNLMLGFWDLFDCLGYQKIPKKPKNLTWSLSKSKGLGPSGVLPLNAPRRVSMTQESFSP